MSNWRISLGLGPIRYIRGINKPKTEGTTPLGCLLTVAVVVGLVYLCCWGGVAWMNSQQ